MKNFFAIICAATLFITGCNENSPTTSAKEHSTLPIKSSVTIQINGKIFDVALEDNPTARAFAEILPLECDVNELNGNEKYFYLADDLPSNAVNVKQIHAGDLMLFGSKCVVIFYKDFATTYSYTRLGKLKNSADLEKILGTSNVRVKFSKS